MINSRNAGAAIAGASALILGSALASQYLGGLQPCELCIWQRWPYVANIVLGALIAPVAPRRWVAALIALAALVFLLDAGIAAFHVGVEQHWWAGTAACGANQGPVTSIEEMRARLLATPMVRCDEIAFQFLGLSMAGWNMLAALALAIASAHAARRLA